MAVTSRHGLYIVFGREEGWFFFQDERDVTHFLYKWFIKSFGNWQKMVVSDVIGAYSMQVGQMQKKFLDSTPTISKICSFTAFAACLRCLLSLLVSSDLLLSFRGNGLAKCMLG